MGDRQVFIGNLCNISIEELRAYCETYGPIAELVFNRDKDNNVYHCFAFVTFQSTRQISEFMLNRPHKIHGEEVFVKRALPRSISSIPERIIVTNRLILQDLHKYSKRLIENYFQKFGHIKKIDIEHGFIDYQDYDNVDCVLLARPHFIHEKEIIVTKFIPSEQENPFDNQNLRSNQHNRITTNNHHHHLFNTNEQPERIITISTNKFKQNSSEFKSVNQQSNNDNIDLNYLNIRYDQLEQQFQQYKQSKESELSTLRMDLERTKQQLSDATQEKLDRLLNNQQAFYDEMLFRLFSKNTSIQTQTNEEYFQSPTNNLTKKRKLTSPTVRQEYEYYS